NAMLTAGTNKPTEDRHASAWCIGGIAGFTAMFVQSNFSFVFHLVPQTILMGICLACAACGSRDPGNTSGTVVSKTLLTVTALLCVAFILPLGLKATKVTHTLWPTMFQRKPLTTPDARINGLTTAIELWPDSTFFRERAAIYQNLARDSGEAWASSMEIQNALDDYQVARKLHPYEPVLAINHANLLSALGRDSEAEMAYSAAIQLQGGMEAGFFGNFHFANHLYKKGLRQFLAGKYMKANDTLENAVAHIDRSMESSPWREREFRVPIHESLGTAKEKIRDYTGALETYDKTSTMVHGATAHYRAGVLLGRMAVEAWANRKPSDALALFLEAKKRATASNSFPKDVTPKQRAEYLAYLDRTIKFLEGARVTPSPFPIR
ncbi:MAG: hypothetical protein ACRCXD_18840, partial [Luteolibacter sp.]